MLLVGVRKRMCTCTCAFLPKVIPLGHWRSDTTKTCRSTPFIPDFSILAGSPQSDQYRKLQEEERGQIQTFAEIRLGPNTSQRGPNTPGERVHSNRRRLLQASVKQNLHLCAVEVGYRNCFGAKVRPVQVFIDPVHSDPHRSLDIIHHFTVHSDVSSFVQHRAERYKRGNASTFKISNRLAEIYRAQWIFSINNEQKPSPVVGYKKTE